MSTAFQLYGLLFLDGKLYTTVYKYLRISSKHQEGLDTQKHVLDTFFKNDLATLTDVGSAYGEDASQPCIEDLLKRRVSGAFCILVYSASRFGRDVSRAQERMAQLHEYGCCVYSVSENVSSHDPGFVTKIAQAQAASQLTSTVIRASIQRRKAQGAHIGPAPYGYKIMIKDGLRTIEKDEKEQVGLEILSRDVDHSSMLHCLIDEHAHSRNNEWKLAHVKTARKALIKYGLIRDYSGERSRIWDELCDQERIVSLKMVMATANILNGASRYHFMRPLTGDVAILFDLYPRLWFTTLNLDDIVEYMKVFELYKSYRKDYGPCGWTLRYDFDWQLQSCSSDRLRKQDDVYYIHDLDAKYYNMVKVVQTSFVNDEYNPRIETSWDSYAENRINRPIVSRVCFL